MKLSNPKTWAYMIWLLTALCFLGISVFWEYYAGLNMEAWGMVLGLGVVIPLIVFGLPLSIVLFIIGVVADRRTRREQEASESRDQNP